MPFISSAAEGTTTELMTHLNLGTLGLNAGSLGGQTSLRGAIAAALGFVHEEAVASGIPEQIDTVEATGIFCLKALDYTGDLLWSGRFPINSNSPVVDS